MPASSVLNRKRLARWTAQVGLLGDSYAYVLRRQTRPNTHIYILIKHKLRIQVERMTAVLIENDVRLVAFPRPLPACLLSTFDVLRRPGIRRSTLLRRRAEVRTRVGGHGVVEKSVLADLADEVRAVSIVHVGNAFLAVQRHAVSALDPVVHQ